MGPPPRIPGILTLIRSAVSPFGAKLPVPALVPSTTQQQRDYDAAGLRRANRLQSRQQLPLARQKLEDVDAVASAELSSAAADAAAASRPQVACSSTSVTQVESLFLRLGGMAPACVSETVMCCGCKSYACATRETSCSILQVETVLPSHTNMHGTAFGGTVMSWIDSCASLSASRGGRCAVVAAGFDEIAFVAPLRLGEHAVIHSKVTRSWGTSLEVGA